MSLSTKQVASLVKYLQLRQQPVIMRVFSATRSRASNKYYEKWSLSGGRRCFAFLLARNASGRLAGWESGLGRLCAFNGDEDKSLRSLPLLLQRGAIKAAYLEMTSARSPAQREHALLSFSPFFPRSLFCPEQTHGKLQRCQESADSHAPNRWPRVSLTCRWGTK